MTCKTSYGLHHNFAKIAEESGFNFNVHRPRTHIDWNKIRSIDIDNVIRDRRFVTIEQYVNDVLDCVLESEFDVRILDEGVVKLFRLAQLTIEYQQFCRQHLDRSVILLREEVIAIMQEIDKNKKEMRFKDEEIRKLKKKTKHVYKPNLPYGHDNIAAMILKTLSNNDLASPGIGDRVQHYNKCKFCDKVFLNQLYLKGHMLRRHPAEPDHMNYANMEAEEKNDQTHQYVVENSKLRNEIQELKNKLEDMNRKFEKTENKLAEIETERKSEVPNKENREEKLSQEKEVAEKSILEKFEEWKLSENQKYKSEISLLKEQIMENINSMKDTRLEESQQQNHLDIIQPLHNIIKEQSSEILSLKQELTKAIKNIEQINKNKDLEVKNRVESPPRVLHIDAGQQYENLSNGWNSPKKSITRQRTNVSNLSDAATCTDPTDAIVLHKRLDTMQENTIDNTIHQNFLHKRQKSLEELHRKTQELLNFNSTSDTTSSDDKTPVTKEIKRKVLAKQISTNGSKKNSRNKNTNVKLKRDETKHLKNRNKEITEEKIKKSPKQVKIENHIPKKKLDISEEDSLSDNVEEETIHSSPAKLVRAKITEEVNKRLVTLGVDPLKMGLRNDVFKKQRTQLQHDEEVKKKRNSSYEKTRHKILSFLDTKAAEESESRNPIINRCMDEKLVRNFKFTSVLSNVKNKALSLIKSRDLGNRTYRKSIKEEMKESMFQTPSPQRQSSPDIIRNAATKEKESKIGETKANVRKAFKVQVAKHKTKYGSDSDDKDSIDEIYEKRNVIRPSSKSIESLINSPIKRPATANDLISSPKNKYLNSDTTLTRTQSAVELETLKAENTVPEIKRFSFKDNYQDSDESLTNNKSKKFLSDENIFVANNHNATQNTKGVLKNAPSNSSLSKKKVIFDLDANQTKSVSASPSQSSTEKKDLNVDVIQSINLEEEWDISSIESHPIRASNENLTSKSTTKVAELTQRIESQLARRGDHKPPGVGSIDLMRGLAGGSNTSLGSSVLDDTEAPSPRAKLDNVSDIDLSEFSVDGLSKEYKVK